MDANSRRLVLLALLAMVWLVVPVPAASADQVAGTQTQVPASELLPAQPFTIAPRVKSQRPLFPRPPQPQHALRPPQTQAAPGRVCYTMRIFTVDPAMDPNFSMPASGDTTRYTMRVFPTPPACR